MGDWAKILFGRENIGRTGIVFAGGTKKDVEKEILNTFDEVLFSKEKIYHSHLVRKGKKTYPIIVNLLGAPPMMDVLSMMHEGGCRNIIFIGYAYGGFQDLDVGTFVLPTKAYHYEGLYHVLKLDKRYSLPNQKQRNSIKNLLKKNKISFAEGINISVPSVIIQPQHKNKDYKRIKPLTVEMELAACFSRAKEIGIRSSGILIVSDNKHSSVKETKERNFSRVKMLELLRIIVDNLNKINLKPLKNSDKFNLDKHMAEIIEDPDDPVNVYLEKSNS